MDETRHSLTPIGSIASFAVAVTSVCLTAVITLNRSTPSPEAIEQNISIFDVNSGVGLMDIIPKRFGFPITNRTIWETVSTSEFHAGLQRLEPNTWIPTHAHETEEVIMIVSGQASLYDENGFERKLATGCMVHIKRKLSHAIHNTAQDKPLLLMWVFPRKFGYNKFEFQDTYQQS